MAGKLSYLLLCILNPFRDFCSAWLFVDVEALGSVELVSAAIIFMIIYGLQQSKLSTWEQTDSESERLHWGIAGIFYIRGKEANEEDGDGGQCVQLVKAAATKLTLNSHTKTGTIVKQGWLAGEESSPLLKIV